MALLACGQRGQRHWPWRGDGWHAEAFPIVAGRSERLASGKGYLLTLFRLLSYHPDGYIPQNPNGKVDKPALPFPDTAELSLVASRRSSRNSLMLDSNLGETYP